MRAGYRLSRPSTSKRPFYREADPWLAAKKDDNYRLVSEWRGRLSR